MNCPRRALRDLSLITGRGGGGTKREGWHVKFYNEKGGGKSFSHAEWGAHSFGVVFTRYLEVLAILMRKGGGGCKRLPPFKKGGGS